MNITLDKIASATKNLTLTQNVKISTDIPAKSGQVIAAEVLENKEIYNKLEVIGAAQVTLKKGDKIAVVLGNRQALKGFVGEVPKNLKPGDVIQLLNLGGIAGKCTSENLKVVGHALNIKVIGAITEDNKPLNIADKKLFEPHENLKKSCPIIMISGTCMNVGKTYACTQLIKEASKNGLKVASAKITGIACQKDLIAMEKAGSIKSISFLDGGHSSTIDIPGIESQIAKGAINFLNELKPDLIIIELGDGVCGPYGVMNILKDPEISQATTCHIGCANDPLGAIKLVEVCQEIQNPVHVISGPCSDNNVGTDFLENSTNIPTINALYKSSELFSHLKQSCLN